MKISYRMLLFSFPLTLALTTPPLLWGQANLENPSSGSYQSGISLVSGWKCTAGTITVTFDNGPPVQVLYGSTREDTRGVCGDANNGFGLLWNWNLLGEGIHTIRAYDSSIQFASATFTVGTLGTEFLSGASAHPRILDFPQQGLSTFLRWQEGQQNFAITGVCPPLQGCCSGHGDVCDCREGVVICCDDTPSPTCRLP